MLFQIFSSIIYSFFAAFRYDIDYRHIEEYEQMIENAGIALNLHKFSRDEISMFNTINLIIELFFLLEIILSLITSYVDENNKLITNFAKIRSNYIHNGLLWDLICIAPFYPIFRFRGSRFFFLIKCLRLNEAFEILDVKVFYKEI